MAEKQAHYQYSTIQANEGLVNGLGDFNFNWVSLMPGTGGYLARDDFYDNDGCYTFRNAQLTTLEENHTLVSLIHKLGFFGKITKPVEMINDIIRNC